MYIYIIYVCTEYIYICTEYLYVCTYGVCTYDGKTNESRRIILFVWIVKF